MIQRAEHRDAQAVHARLDELLKVHGDAKNALMTIDDQDAEDVERESANFAHHDIKECCFCSYSVAGDSSRGPARGMDRKAWARSATFNCVCCFEFAEILP